MANQLLTSREAARRLGVSSATLYAYVSRGLIRSHAEPGRRERGYRSDEIAALQRHRKSGRGGAAVAASALDFGRPLLDSALTLIAGNQLFYRGQDAARLARTASLEEVAALLWQCDAFPFAVDNLPTVGPALRRAWLAAAPLPPLDRCLAILPIAGALDPASWSGDAAALRRTGARLLRLSTAAVAGRPPSPEPVHLQLARAWRLDATGAGLVRAAMVLMADHEFNASAFAARVVASTGANLHAALVAGLAALSGPKHGGLTARVAALFAEAAAAGDIEAVLAARLRQRIFIPGFGHRLYPDGDIRATTLLALLREALPDHPGTRLALDLASAAQRLIGRPPNIDFATVALQHVLGLPEHSALAMFVIGRTVGWTAHALEQAALDELIRPRARYTGPPPAA